MHCHAEFLDSARSSNLGEGESVLPFILNDPRKSSLQASGLCFQEFAILSWLLVHPLYTLCLAEFCVKHELRRHLSLLFPDGPGSWVVTANSTVCKEDPLLTVDWDVSRLTNCEVPKASRLLSGLFCGLHSP